ncbi:MAG: hypothetical protein B6242_02385 [Anaerolineaceae bacterium 4572_78]|nr:MAG: hypothetical protein B6242_02385 [Anaerolineaceae bacterium 4572_78]
MNKLAIETHHLRKEYGLKVAVDDLTLQVPCGEVFGFLGPNGAGKSTTLKMLVGLVRPTHGEVKILDESPRNYRNRAKIGFLPEHFRFHEWLTAHEFLHVHGKLYGLSKQQLHKRIPELLEQVNLADATHTSLGNFSKGMLQRVGLAQAMLNKPEIIFLDEPTSGLDPLGTRLVRDIISNLKAEGTTVFLNSHLLSEVSVTCDRVAFIKKGVVIHTNTMEKLLSQTMALSLRVDAISQNLHEALKSLDSHVQLNGTKILLTVKDDDQVAHVAQMVHEHGAKLYELTPRHQSLEEIFVSIISTDGEDRT